MFAMAIIGVVLAAAYATASKNLQTSQLAKERTQATNIAEAQVEQLKNVGVDITESNFCLDLTRADAVITTTSDTPDPACTEGFYSKTITKTDNKYKVLIEWTPPGGSDTNKANVTIYYSDYDFALTGSGNISIFTVSPSSGTAVTLGASIRNETNITRSGLVYSTSQNPRLNDAGSTAVDTSVASASYNLTITGLDPAVVYYVRAFAVTSNGTIYSVPIPVNGVAPVASPVTAPTITGLAESPGIFTANITGSINAGGGTISSRLITYYRLNSSGNPTNQTTINLSSNTINTTLSSLEPGVQYYYTVSATNSAGTTTSTVRSLTTRSVPPGIVNVGEFVDVSSGGRRSIYYLSNDSVTCRQAREAALTSGGHLVTIGSQAENDFVSTFAGTNIWIGFNDITTEGTWQWDNNEFAPWIFDTAAGRPAAGNTTWTNWSSSEPNNFPHVDGEDCAVMNWGGQNGLWNDLPEVSDIYRSRYVIEYEIN
jgi:hypothetical protein